MNIDSPLRRTDSKRIFGEQYSLIKNHDFNSFVTIVEIESINKRERSRG